MACPREDYPWDAVDDAATPRTTGRFIVTLRDPMRARSRLRAAWEQVELGTFPDVDTFRHPSVCWYRRLGVAVVSRRIARLIQPELGHGHAVFPAGAPFGAIVPERLRFGQGAPAAAAPASWPLGTTGVLASTRTGKGARVAILDSGIDVVDGSFHPDFQGRVARAPVSFVPLHPDEPGGKPWPVRDVLGHGTSMAGIACGPAVCTQNGVPRYGVAPDAELFVGKVMVSRDGEPAGIDEWIFAGIDWALANGCHVALLAFGADGDAARAAYDSVAAAALDGELLLVAAAGNSSTRPVAIGPVLEPASCRDILAVGALATEDAIHDDSAGGAGASGGEVNLCAPGLDVIAPRPRCAGPLHLPMAGTSAAAAFVAGVAALHVEAGHRGRGLRRELERTAARLPPNASPGYDRDFGAGRVSAPP
jgi:subtilisin family serine protease